MTPITNEDDEYGEYSDNEISTTEHPKLLAAITQLDGKQRVKPPSRKEPSLQVSEFHLVQTGPSEANLVELQDLAKVLDSRGSHADIGRKLRGIKKKTKTLPKPLEKPVAERIQRSVGFTQVKKQLSRWDAVVHKNRVADQLVFPLNQTRFKLDTSIEFLSRFKTQSPLELQIAEILNASKVVTEERKEREEIFSLSLEELALRRKEMAHLRAQQSYLEAKARRQGKIKSKTYHRLQRRERTHKQLKDFEILQKTDPEAALKQLELIERARAEERMTLRHRSTGQWARNRAVRAKYDQQSRQALAEQLAISRDLTQKVQPKDISDDDDEDEEEEVLKTSPDNPWMQCETGSEMKNFVNEYRKYREERHKKEASAKQTRDDTAVQCNQVQGSIETGTVVAQKQGNFAQLIHEVLDEQKSIDNAEQNSVDNLKKISAIGKTKGKKCKPDRGGRSHTPIPVSTAKVATSCSTVTVSNKAQSNTCKISAPSKGVHKKTEKRKNKHTDRTAIEQQLKAVNKTSKMKHAKVVAINTTPLNIQSSVVGTQKSRKTSNISTCEPLSPKIKTGRTVGSLLKIDRVEIKQKKGLVKKNAEGARKRKLRNMECMFEVSPKKPVGTSTAWVVTPNNTPNKDESKVKRQRKTKKAKVKSKDTKNDIQIDDMFDKMEERLQETVTKKLAKLKHDINIVDEDIQEEQSDTEGPSLEMKSTALRPQEDVGLSEETGRGHRSTLSGDLVVNHLSKVAALQNNTGGLERSKIAGVREGASRLVLSDIDPNKFMAVKPRRLKTQLPDNVTGGDEGVDDDEEDQRMTITEAFAEDDVVAEFRTEKEEAVAKSKPQDMDLTLPGWGSWGGKNLGPPKRKKRRFIIKFPEVAPRKDQNKGNLILNEEKDTKVKEHLVSDLPFPFTSVNAFEASIRAPIGNTFIPETAHHKLIKPHIITKLGTVIQPMDEEVLVDTKKKKKKMTFN